MAPTRQPKHWIFLRGLTREAGHWGSFIEAFRTLFPDDILHLPDLPGAGQHWNQPTPATIEGITRWMRERLEPTLPPDAPVHLLAISLGGMIATEWIHQTQRPISKVVLINTSHKNLSPFYRRIRPTTLLRFLALPILPDPAMREKIVLSVTSNDDARRGAAFPSWSAIQVERPVSTRTFLKQMKAGAVYAMPEISHEFPILLVASRKDRVVSARCSEQLAAHWNADLIYHPTAGHDIPLDDPAWLARTVREWVNLREGARR